MGGSSAWPHCPWCERHHAETYACEPVRKFLKGIAERGESLTVPTLEFPDAPMPMIGGFGEPGDEFMTQLVVQGATVPVAGLVRAGLVFTGRGHSGKPLPRWLYVDTDEHINAAAKLVDDMARASVASAQRQR